MGDRLAGLARSLRDGDAVVSYTGLDHNEQGQAEIAIGVVTRARTTAYLAPRPETIRDDVRALGDAIEANDDARAREVGKRLYDVLLAPIERDLQGARRVFVSPHLSLQALPWGALFDGARFAVAR